MLPRYKLSKILAVAGKLQLIVLL